MMQPSACPPGAAGACSRVKGFILVVKCKDVLLSLDNVS